MRKCTKIEWSEAGAPIQVPIVNGAFVQLDRKALLVGGYSPVLKSSVTQTLEFDFTTRQWAPSISLTFPHPISEATACTVGQTCYLFGGWDDKTVRGEMWKIVEGPKGLVWELVPPSSEQPCARRGHSMISAVVEEATRVFMFGGFDGERRLNDLWEFVVDSNEWKCIEATGMIPSPRDGCALAMDTTNNRLILFGGYGCCRLSDIFFYNFETNTWVEHPNLSGPTPRHNCFAVVNGPFFIVGLGQDSKGPASLICQLNLTEMKWSVASFEGDEIEGRIYSSNCSVDFGKKVLVFGGTNEKKYSTSLLELEFEKGESLAVQKGKK